MSNYKKKNIYILRVVVLGLKSEIVFMDLGSNNHGFLPTVLGNPKIYKPFYIRIAKYIFEVSGDR